MPVWLSQRWDADLAAIVGGFGESVQPRLPDLKSTPALIFVARRQMIHVYALSDLIVLRPARR